MTLLASTGRAVLFLGLALLGLPLVVYGSGQMQLTGLAGVATGFSLLALQALGFMFAGPAHHRHAVAPRNRGTAQRMRDRITWDDVAQTRPARPKRGQTYRIR